MAYLTKAPRGTADVLPEESYKVRFSEKTVSDTAALFGFKEIRTPVFEHTELFQRGVGETTDVVQKEMYTFEDNGQRSITLRPEGTAGTVRAFLEHGLFNEPMPQKYYYLTSCYRYEKPQAGRLREFHQFGVESFGSESPACRKNFQAALREYFGSKREQLCETCLGRLEKNPMRILDCKSPECAEIAKGAPKVLDYLCEECETHFAAVQKYLRALDIDFTVNPTIVRGLDYYTKTVFEFVAGNISAQSTVCGGGRYDGLVAELGGGAVPACGFGMGIERLKLLLEAQGIAFPEEKRPEIYIAPAKEEYGFEAMRLTDLLRREGVFALTDVSGRSLKAQMKFANKKEALFTLVLGDEEIASCTAKAKNMSTGEETAVRLDHIQEDITGLLVSAMFGGDDAVNGAIANLTLLNGGKK